MHPVPLNISTGKKTIFKINKERRLAHTQPDHVALARAFINMFCIGFYSRVSLRPCPHAWTLGRNIILFSVKAFSPNHHFLFRFGLGWPASTRRVHRQRAQKSRGKIYGWPMIPTARALPMHKSGRPGARFTSINVFHFASNGRHHRRYHCQTIKLLGKIRHKGIKKAEQVHSVGTTALNAIYMH